MATPTTNTERPTYEVADRVWYRDHGPEDRGIVTAVEIIDGECWYHVVWSDGQDEDEYADDQLGPVPVTEV